MSISPLNITVTGDSGSYVPTSSSNARPDPVVSTVAPAATPQAQRSSASDVAYAVDKLNDFVSTNAADLNFSQDKATGKTIVKVIDKSTDTIIRQIPSEEAIAMAQSIEKMQGLMINHKA